MRLVLAAHLPRSPNDRGRLNSFLEVGELLFNNWKLNCNFWILCAVVCRGDGGEHQKRCEEGI